VSLYKLRHWFAHGAIIPEMKEPSARVQTLDDGFAAAKEVLRAACSDDGLLEAAPKGARSVERYLED
jgi:hypothetical protein